ncbi:hypothetical protein GWI33_022272 [Rhynchophorus ferrugineus]|uniref:E3 UFM1-protein ligase 1 homolog n=1 Tax=Rhynchophorus ferrugineus TaxID=354439 RepID=A0A834INM0_RHYFE|nr:hypothetical protein GWI33_022272 [Rhynchophorus ferrugineus]
MADWDEIKRLAADFQKVQLSSTTQRLSERNCVEIVSWLIEKKLIELIFTSDGKEYLTSSQLISDIQNELYVAGGRINLVELAKIIGVDLAHINTHINEVLKGRKDIHNILGQLIDSSYIVRIAGEINEKLQQQGQINQQVLEKYLDKLIFGKQDKNDAKVFFTEAFIARSKSKLRGALLGLTKPTPVASILSHVSISEKLFFSLFDQSCGYGSLTSKLPGAQYIPSSYSRSQVEWVNNFFRQNGYLEFDALMRIGITDYKTYLKKQLPNEDLLYLESTVISKRILDRVEADIEECIASKSYVDLQSNLPSVFTSRDIEILLNEILSGQNKLQTIVLQDFVLSKLFLENFLCKCDELVKEKATDSVQSGKYQQYITDLHSHQHKPQKNEDVDERVDKKEERRKKAAGGKTGGGTQGRETKTRSTKKHTRGVSKIDDNDETEADIKKTFEILTESDVAYATQDYLEEEGLDILTDSITSYLTPMLNVRGYQIATELFQSTVADRTANHYLKKVSNCFLLIFNHTVETMSNVVTDNFNNEQRLKFVNELPPEFKNAFLPLAKSLTGQSIDDFMTAADLALAACSMIIKKVDKKKDRAVVLNHKHELLEKLNNCDDVALVLHLATLAIFTTATQCMLHASGRHITTILAFLKPYLSTDHFSELMSYHDFVTLMLSNGSEAENAKEKLMEKVQTIKGIATEFKKTQIEKT